MNQPLRSASAPPPNYSQAPRCPTCRHPQRFATDGIGRTLLVCDECERRQHELERKARLDRSALERVARMHELTVDDVKRRLALPKAMRTREHRGVPYVCDCGAEIKLSATVKRRRRKCENCRRKSKKWWPAKAVSS